MARAKGWLQRKVFLMPITVSNAGNEILLESGGLRISLPASVSAQVAALLPPAATSATNSTELVLSEDHPMWDHHSGGNRNTGERWDTNEGLEYARSLRRYLPDKASAFFEMLLREPGRLFTSDEIARSLGLKSPSAVAGALNGFVKPGRENKRPYPFYWWEGADGRPTRYAVRPSIAAAFIAAGD